MIGTKNDSGKPRADLLPPIALLQVARVFGYGACKYDDYNYRNGLGHERIYAAAQRHLLSWWSGEEYDPETGESHLAHAACSVLMLMDNRYGSHGESDGLPEQVHELTTDYAEVPD